MRFCPSEPGGGKHPLVFLERVGVSLRRRRQHDQTEFGNGRRRDAILVGDELQRDHTAIGRERVMDLAQQRLAGRDRKMMEEIGEEDQVVAKTEILLKGITGDRAVTGLDAGLLGHLLRDGKDALIVSSGFMTMRALEAVEALREDNVDVAVLHAPTIKPLDEETIVREASRSGRLVIVAENHSVIGGLGEAIAGVLLRAGVTPPFRQIALPDAFLDAGALPTLHDKYGVSTNAIVQSIKGWL